MEWLAAGESGAQEGEVSQASHRSQRSYGISEKRLPKSVIQTYDRYREHKELGDEMRLATMSNLAIKHDIQATHTAKGNQEWHKRQQAQRDIRKQRQAILVSRFEESTKLQGDKALWRGKVEEMKQQAKDWGKEMSAIEKKRLALMDTKEEETAEMLRLEGSAMKIELSEGAKAVRAHLYETKKKMRDAVKESTERRVAAAAAQVARDRVLSGQAVREVQKAGREIVKGEKAQYLTMAQQSQADTLALRAKIKEVSRREFRRRKKMADEIRDEDYSGVAGDQYYKELHDREVQAAEIYSQRYGGEEEGEGWNGSPLEKLHDAARWAKHIIGRSIWGPDELNSSVAEVEATWKYTTYNAQRHVPMQTGTR